MAEKITVARIDAVEIPDGSNEVKLWDAAVGGLCLRCFASGARTWAFRYRAGSGGRAAKIRSLRLGSYPGVTIDAARSAARGHAAAVAAGQDPAAIRQEERRQAKSTLGHLLEEGGAYQRSLQARHIVKRNAVLSVLRRGLARYADVDIAKLTRLDLVAAITALDGRPGAQHELRKHTRGLLEWAVNSGLVQANVLAGMRRPKLTRTERLEAASKRRALDDDDIVAVWNAADREGRFGALVQLTLLTGLRRGEVSHLRWDDVAGDRILVAPDRAKTGVAHEVPLTDLMRAIIERQTRTTSPLIFPSNATGRAVADWCRPKDRLVRDAGVGDWSMHDLRRTTRTLMSRLGVPDPIAELAIGHSVKGLIGLYNLDSSWLERVDAFERVSDHIGRLVGAA